MNVGISYVEYNAEIWKRKKSKIKKKKSECEISRKQNQSRKSILFWRNQTSYFLKRVVEQITVSSDETEQISW